MEIIISKLFDHNTLKCIRLDSSSTKSRLGPSLPAHDLAHYVIEKQLRLSNGFFGHISQGKSIEYLSDPENLKEVHPELMLSEILTRTLQSLHSGSLKISDFNASVKWECENLKLSPLFLMEDKISLLLQCYTKVVKRFDSLAINESMSIQISFCKV